MVKKTTPLDLCLKKTGLTRKQLANKLRITYQAVYLWDQDGISLKRLPELSKLSGMSYSELRPDIFGK